MKLFFEELFEYNFHQNRKLIAIISDSSSQISDKALKLLNHVLNSHHIWNKRIASQEHYFGVWNLHELNDLKNINDSNFEETIQLINKSDINTTITYSNSKGEVYYNSIRDILFHIINHSTYHRGQIALDSRQNGFEPVVTDYIVYKRQICRNGF